MFFPYSEVRIPMVTDGTSNTLMTSEILLSPDKAGNDFRGRMYNSWCGNNLFSTGQPPNPVGVPDRLPYCQSIPTAPCTTTSTNIVVYARSAHTGGVNAGLADGSVRFVSNNVTPLAWLIAGSRSGGEVPLDF
jgi:prepilin-type processing-associated H-X9-DG protein